MQSSDDVSCSDCKLELIQRVWTEILLKWLNKCVNTDKEIKFLAPTCLADIMNKYKEDICENDIDRAILCTDDIEPFIKYKYPILRLRYLAEASDYQKKQYIMTSVLLFHCCIRSQSGIVHADICKKMSKYEQEIILKFCERLDDMEITINNVDCAIKEAFEYVKYVRNIPKNTEPSSSQADQASTDESALSSFAKLQSDDKLTEVASKLPGPSTYNSSLTVLPSVITDTSTYSDLATESEISALNKYVFSDSDDVIVYPVNHPNRKAPKTKNQYAESKHKMGGYINVEINNDPFNCGGSCCQRDSYYECEPYSDHNIDIIEKNQGSIIVIEPRHKRHKNDEIVIHKSEDETDDYEDYNNYNTDSDERFVDNTQPITKARPLDTRQPVDTKYDANRNNIGMKQFDDTRDFSKAKQFVNTKEMNKNKHTNDTEAVAGTKKKIDAKYYAGKKQFAETKHCVDEDYKLRPLLYNEDLKHEDFCKPCCGPNEDGKPGYHDRVTLKSKNKAEADKYEGQSQRIQEAEQQKADGKSAKNERVSLKSKNKAEVDKFEGQPQQIQDAEEQKADGKSAKNDRVSLKSKNKAEVDKFEGQPQQIQDAEEQKADGKSAKNERVSLKSKKKADANKSDDQPQRIQEAEEQKTDLKPEDYCKPCCGPKEDGKPAYHDRVSLKPKTKADDGDQPQRNQETEDRKTDCLCDPKGAVKEPGEDGSEKALLCNKAKCIKEMLIKKKWIVIAIALVLLILILLACILPFVLTRKQQKTADKGEKKQIEPFNEPPNKTERFAKYANFRMFHEIHLFICVNRICKKVYEPVTDNVYTSLSRCSLICMGPQLWPYPIGYTSFSNKIVAIATNKLEYKFQSIPSEAVNQYLAEAFKLFIGDLAKLERINDQKEKNITESDDMRVRKMSIQIDVETDPEPRLRINTEESYNLKLETDNNILVIKISSASFCGVRHGLQTLRQLILLDQSSGKLITLSSAVIKDSPSYRYRGLMIDTARNYIPVADLMRTIDAMATVKLNTFHWRISDVTSFPLYLPTVPELFEYGAYDKSMIYTKEDVKYLVNRAAVRGIRVVMEVAAPGPVGRAWSWHPEVSCPTKTANYTCSNLLCLRLQLHDSIMDILQTIYTEILEMTKVDDVFHLSDGVFSMTNCYYLIEERHGFLDKALERLKRANKGFMPKLPIVWHTAHLLRDFEAKTWEQYGVQLADMPSDPADNVLSKYRVIHSSKWDLSCEMKKNRCTKYRTWQEMYSWKSWRNIESFTVEGGEAVLWTDLVNSGNLDSHIWPRAAAVAERLWSDIVANRSSSAPIYTRLDNQRWRMLLYGVKVQPIWPLWCSLNPSECLEKVR